MGAKDTHGLKLVWNQEHENRQIIREQTPKLDKIKIHVALGNLGFNVLTTESDMPSMCCDIASIRDSSFHMHTSEAIVANMAYWQA